MSSAPPLPPLRVALAGNPNCGKTALFNLLTGSRQKVANYAGVTVERKEGTFRTPSGRAVRVLDLPGLYSLEPQSPDEQVTADLLCGRLPDEPAPEVVVGVLDSTDLRRHLRLALALRRSGLPLVLALNMTDLAWMLRALRRCWACRWWRPRQWNATGPWNCSRNWTGPSPCPCSVRKPMKNC